MISKRGFVYLFITFLHVIRIIRLSTYVSSAIFYYLFPPLTAVHWCVSGPQDGTSSIYMYVVLRPDSGLKLWHVETRLTAPLELNPIMAGLTRL